MSSAPVLHVETFGEGPLVVFGHGFGGSGRNFRNQARALKDQYRVLLFDARGHARSEAPTDATAYQPERFVSDLEALIDSQGAERAVVGGLSMGAGVALRFALSQPERVCGLVLAAPPPGRDAGQGGNTWPLEFADAIERDGLDAAGAEFAWGPSSGLDEAGAKLVRQGFLEHAPHALVHTARELLAQQPSVVAMASQLEALDIPTLIIVGTRDQLSLAVARDLSQALPRARLVEVEGAGHVVNLAAPRQFNDELLAFLASLDA